MWTWIELMKHKRMLLEWDLMLYSIFNLEILAQTLVSQKETRYPLVLCILLTNCSLVRVGE